MGSHPVNLLLRFILEISALISLGIWGWNQFDNGFKYLMAIGLPVLSAGIWGVFAVPDDPSRSGKAPVPVPGVIRLIYELLLFGFSGYALLNLNYTLAGTLFLIIVIIHYALSYDRIRWLLKS